MLRWSTPSVSAAHSRKKTSREVEIEDGVLGAGAIREDGGLGVSTCPDHRVVRIYMFLEISQAYAYLFLKLLHRSH